MQLNYVGPVIQELHENLLLNIVDTKLALDGLEQDDHSLSLLPWLWHGAVSCTDQSMSIAIPFVVANSGQLRSLCSIPSTPNLSTSDGGRQRSAKARPVLSTQQEFLIVLTATPIAPAGALSWSIDMLRTTPCFKVGSLEATPC